MKLEKDEFIMQYVLARANTVHGPLSGKDAGFEAISAWYTIKKEISKSVVRNR